MLIQKRITADDFIEMMREPGEPVVSARVREQEEMFAAYREKLITLSSDLKMLDWLAQVADPSHLKKTDALKTTKILLIDSWMTQRTNVIASKVGREILLGKVVQMTTIGIERIPFAMVRAQMNEFNMYLKKNFARSFDFWAIDRHSVGGLGDTVLIRQLDESQRPSESVSHRVEKVVFKYGNIIDPVTGKRVISGTFNDEMELKKKLVEEIVDEPFQEDALLFEERHALQSRRLTEARESSV